MGRVVLKRQLEDSVRVPEASVGEIWLDDGQGRFYIAWRQRVTTMEAFFKETPPDF
jgi:hypothetical protein